MAFAPYSIPLGNNQSLSHPIDQYNAVAWLTEATRLTSPAAFEDLEKRSYGEQVAGVRAAFLALGNFYRAMNLPPQSDPIYVLAWQKWFGHAQQVEGAFANAQKIGATVSGGQTGGNPISNDFPAEFRGNNFILFQWFLTNWNRLRKPPINQDAGLCNIVLRMVLNTDAELVTKCASGRYEGDDDLCNFGGNTLWVGCVQDGASSEGCPEYNWNTLMWHDPPPAGIPAGYWCRVQRALPPLKWFLYFVQDVVNQINGRGADVINQTLIQSFVYQFGFNAAQARKYQLERQNASLVPLIQASQSITADAATVVAQQQATARAAIATGASLASSFAGPYAPLVVAVGAALSAIASVTPFAVGTETDTFGRAEPMFQKWFISGEATPQNTPTHSVPEAPSVIRPMNLGLTPVPIQLGGVTVIKTPQQKLVENVGAFAIAGAIGYAAIKILTK